MINRSELPIVGVLTHNFLREPGLLQLMKEVRVALFAPPDSVLHRFADFSCPIPSCDISEGDLEAVIRAALSRKINIKGFTTWRDYNIPAVAAITSRFGWVGMPIGLVSAIESKSAFRDWLNNNIELELHNHIEYRLIEKGCSPEFFERVLKDLLHDGPVILKPDQGSCSYHIIRLTNCSDIPVAWQKFCSAANFRNGNFIAERMVKGVELSVETIVDKTIRKICITQYLPGDSDHHYEIGHFATRIKPAWANMVEQLSIEIHSRLGLTNVITHMEMMVVDNGLPAIIELNPRIAGGLIPELHRLVSGVDTYRIAGQILLGKPIDESLFASDNSYPSALVRFHPPLAGRIDLHSNCMRGLRTPDDKFGLLQPCGAILTGGDTNDDRSAYLLLAGENADELRDYSLSMMSQWMNVERAGMIISEL